MTPDQDHLAAVPVEVRLEEFILGEGCADFWIPRAATPEQQDAAAELGKAVRRFERAFGTENTYQQFRLFAATAQMISKKNAAARRILDARADINTRAAEARAADNEDLAQQIEAEATPDYPERLADLEALGGGI